MFTRRQLLATAASSLALHAGPKTALDRARLSAISDEIAATPADAIAFAQKYGLTHLELRDVPGAKRAYFNLPQEDLRQAAKEFKDGGIHISFLNTPLLKFALPGTEPKRTAPEDPARRAARLPRDQALFDARGTDLRKSIDAALILGVRDVRVFTFIRIAEPSTIYPRVAEIIGEMAQVAEREGVRLLVENETSCNVSGCAESAAFLKLIPSRAVGLNWDALNGIAYEKPIPDGYQLLPKDRVHNVQIKGKSILNEPEHLDWAAIFKALERDGYNGAYGLETHYFDGTKIEKSHLAMKEMLRLIGQTA